MSRIAIARRRFIRGVGAAAGLAAASACGLPDLRPGASQGANRPALTMWMVKHPRPELGRWLDAIVAETARAGNFDLTVEYLEFDALVGKEAAGVESGELPDLSLTLQPNLWALHDRARDVNDVYQQIGRDGGGWHDAADSLSRMHGRRIGLPLVFDLEALYLRQDIFDQAGVQLPFASFDELLAGLARVTTGGVHGFGPRFGDQSVQQMLGVVFAHGGRFFDRDGAPSLETPATRAGMLAYLDLVTTRKVIPPQAVAWGWDGAPRSFVSGLVAATAMNTQMIDFLREQEPGVLARTVIMPWPAARGGAPAAPADSVHLVINRASPHADRAAQVARAIFSREQYPRFLAAVDPFGQSVLKGIGASEAGQSEAWRQQMRQEVLPHATSVYADGPRSPLAEPLGQAIDAETRAVVSSGKQPERAVADLAASAREIHQRQP